MTASLSDFVKPQLKAVHIKDFDMCYCVDMINSIFNAKLANIISLGTVYIAS